MTAIHTLISILCVVESNSDPNAIGDNGSAVGILQIHPSYVHEVNRLSGFERFTLDDRYDPVKSRRMVSFMMLGQAERYRAKNNGFYPSMELLARWHNGGVYGHHTNPQATDGYWQKVKELLDERNIKYH
jgi:hypothetical protein